MKARAAFGFTETQPGRRLFSAARWRVQPARTRPPTKTANAPADWTANDRDSTEWLARSVVIAQDHQFMPDGVTHRLIIFHQQNGLVTGVLVSQPAQGPARTGCFGGRRRPGARQQLLGQLRRVLAGELDFLILHLQLDLVHLQFVDEPLRVGRGLRIADCGLRSRAWRRSSARRRNSAASAGGPWGF